VTTAAGLLTVLAVLAACASAAQVHPLGSPTSAMAAADPNADRIVQRALAAARASGDTAPHDIEWAYSTRERASQLLELGATPDTFDLPQVVIIMSGTFEARSAHPPRGLPLPTGTVLELVLDTDSWEMSDFGLGDGRPDLTKLGTVFHR
jgi:hypothetical protein